MAMQKISLEDTNIKQDPKGVKTKPPTGKKLPKITIFIVVAVILGGITGVLLANNRISNKKDSGVDKTLQAGPTSAEDVVAGETFGSSDESTFRDSAEGVIQKGGIDGEGSHHLLRPGGSMQTVYLTSSVVDLDLFVGHSAQVWGETFDAKQAGWLMDVGRVKVLELNAELPE